MSKKRMLSIAFVPWVFRRHGQLLLKIRQRNLLLAHNEAIPDTLIITKDDNRFMKSMLSLIRLYTKETK